VSSQQARTLTASGAAADPDSPREPNARFRSGDLVAQRYRLESRLGVGAMGEVWLARHEELNTDVAVKLALVDREGVDVDLLLERFRFEAQVTAQLARRTRHVVAVTDAGSHEGVPYMAMEYVSGRSLEHILRREGRVPVERVVEIVDGAADALAVAHELGVWHRDIKPGNLLVSDSGPRWEVKLADFGVAKAIETRLDVETPRATLEGSLVGTPSFMSPEQVSGAAARASSDLWSLAVVAYVALTGEEPFDGRTLGELVKAIVTTPYMPPSLCPGVPPSIDAWFERALAKAPEDRFESAAAMAAALRRALVSSPRRRSWRLAIAVTCAAAAAASGVVLWHRASAGEPTQPAAAAAPTAEAIAVAPPVPPEPDEPPGTATLAPTETASVPAGGFHKGAPPPPRSSATATTRTPYDESDTH
jgi:eukaryotic-like serine/threonine-protein kinase